MKGTATNAAVFLDRDGTLCEEVTDYLREPSQIRLVPGVLPALKRIQERGLLLVVITNQSGIGRGYFSEEMLANIHKVLLGCLGAENVHITGIYHCPHLPPELLPESVVPCSCRKPMPGLILDAAARHCIDLRSSFMVGDKESDIRAGHLAGCRTVRLNLEVDAPRQWEGGSIPDKPDFWASSWTEAADWILQRRNDETDVQGLSEGH